MTFSFPPETPEWQRRGAPHVWMPYAQMQTLPLPIAVVRTLGVYWELADGRRLLDGLASWWTACHGYNHPTVVRAVAQQLDQMPHVMFAGVHHQPALRLATRLVERLPGDLDYLFFSDSGSVAIEVAIKMALQYWRNCGFPDRVRFLSFSNAYHGDTTGAMSICDPVDSMHACFAALLLQQFTHPLPDTKELAIGLDRFLGQHRQQLAAVVLEPLVQGAGGMKFHSPDILALVARLCRKHDLLLIADEVATGFGRTGTMFACEQADVVPDILCLGKALTAGFLGMAVTIANRRVFDAFRSTDPAQAFQHGPTYMANPLACAAANASLDLFDEEPRLQQVRQIEAIMRYQLSACRQIPGVIDVRTLGAIGVVQVERLHDLARLRQRFIERGVWLRPFGDIIYLTPAFVIGEEELVALCDVMVEVIREWASW